MDINNNNNTYLNDSSLYPKYIMEEILDIYGDSKAELVPEYSKEYKRIEGIVNLQIEEEERKRLKKEKFSILQKSLKKLMIQKLNINFKTIYLVEGTAIFYYDDIFINHLMKDRQAIPVIGHSGRLAFTCKLNDEEVLIVHKSAMKDLLEMNISDQSRIFEMVDDFHMDLCEDFLESPKMEQYIILHGLDIECIENIIKFIDDKIDLVFLHNDYTIYYYLLMCMPYYISALAYYDRACCVNEATIKDNIFDLIVSIILRVELRDYINDSSQDIGAVDNSRSEHRLYDRLGKVQKTIKISDYELFNSDKFMKKSPIEKIVYMANQLIENKRVKFVSSF